MHTLGDAVIRSLRRRTTILPFHRDWIRAAFAPDTEIAALSCPRGSAKTWIAGYLAAECIRPDSPLFEHGIEALAVSASLEQSRIILAFVREALADSEGDYRFLDSGQRLAVTHRATGTRLRILSSSGKRAMGLSQFSTIFADEPGAWESRGGALLWQALTGSLGKRAGQRVVVIGTRAPAEAGSWWPELLDAGSGPGTHITALTAPDDAAWDSWQTLRKVNPLVGVNPSLRKTILRERDAARKNPTLQPAYRAFRLNQQIDVFANALVELPDWKRVVAREVAPRTGKPIVALDIGAERSWSAAWCIWPNGRSEVYAVAPGIPDLAERERQDAVPRGIYRKLYQDGVLLIDEGRRVSRPRTLINHLVAKGISPELILCDRFVLGELKDAVEGRWPIQPRVTRWSEATQDISGFRQLVMDGPLSVIPESRRLAALGIQQASVASDDQGSVRLQKKRHGRSRDDVAVAGVLAAGALARRLEQKPKRRWRYRGAA